MDRLDDRILTPAELVEKLLHSAEKTQAHAEEHPLLETYHLPHDYKTPAPHDAHQK